MRNFFLQKLSYTLLLLLVVAFAQAQLPPPPPPPGPPAGTPIDGAALLFLGAGLVYGARKIYKD